MKISELARQTGVSIRSLRYYEAKRLLGSRRQKNGYRSFDTTAIERVKSIQYYLGLGLTADQIFQVIFCGRSDSSLPSLDESQYSACFEAIALCEERLAEIEAQIAMLEQAKMHLRQHLTLLQASTLQRPG